MELCLHSLIRLLGTDVRIMTDLKHSNKNSILKCVFVAYFTELNTFFALYFISSPEIFYLRDCT